MTRILNYVGPTVNSDGQESVNASQHRRALAGHTNAHGRALMQLLKGWEAYADAHRRQFYAGIGEDHVTGDYWAEAGGLDCGSIAANITSALEAEGFKTDGYSLLD